MMKKTIVMSFIFSTIFLTGCEDKNSVNWYVNNHQDMITKYTECLMAKSWQDMTCQNARSAMNLESEKPDVKEGLRAARQKVMDRSLNKGS